MLYKWCLQFILSLLELLPRTHLHSFIANYLILSISSLGFIFHSYSLGKFMSSAVPLMVVGRVVWKDFCPRLLVSALKCRDVGWGPAVQITLEQQEIIRNRLLQGRFPKSSGISREVMGPGMSRKTVCHPKSCRNGRPCPSACTSLYF